MLRPGAYISDRYRLTRLLGEGGMGAVWGAKNEIIGRAVAIKVMQPELAKHRDAMQRFFNEARICASIRDPGIVDVLDFGYGGDGSPFIVMELLEGESLEERLAREHRLAPAAVLAIVRDVAATLQLAHDQGIVHRDLKPSNIFLHRTARGQLLPKILDFGISKVLGDGSARMTRTGAVIGTPAYMSPEQAAGKPLDHRTDIYALGAIMYEALSGRLPFASESYNALIVEIATTSPPALATLTQDLPQPLIELVEATMARDVSQRVQRAADVAARAEALSAELVPPARTSHPVQRVVPAQRAALTPEHVLAATHLSGTQVEEHPPATEPAPALPRLRSTTHLTPTEVVPRAPVQQEVVQTEVPLSTSIPALRTRRQPLWIAAGAVLTLAAGAALVLAMSWESPEPAAATPQPTPEPTAPIDSSKPDPSVPEAGDSNEPDPSVPEAAVPSAEASGAPPARASSSAVQPPPTRRITPRPQTPPPPPEPPPEPKPPGGAWDYD